MNEPKCEECASVEMIAATKEQMDKKGHIFHVPCWFCEDCYHENPVALMDAEEWLEDYYTELPQEIKPALTYTRSPEPVFGPRVRGTDD
jgi:hypothetical protein